MKNTKTIEDYLEAIYFIEKKGEAVKSVRIAEILSVSRPAVNQAMNELIRKNYITKPAYANITLTPEGKEIAIKVYNRHLLLKDFLTKLGVSEETAEKECCKIEHILSEETINAIKRHLKNIQ